MTGCLDEAQLEIVNVDHTSARCVTVRPGADIAPGSRVP